MSPEDHKELLADLKLKKDLEVMAKSEGGKLLIKGLQTDIVNEISKMTVDYKAKTLQEFVAHAANLNAMLNVYKVLASAETNRIAMQQIVDETLV